MIPQSFINDLIERVDIVDVIGERLPLKRTGKNLKALCPFHNEKTESFTVNSEKQFYYCFGCGATGTSLRFLMEHDKLDFVDAIETLARIAGVEVVHEGPVARQKVDPGILDALAEADTLFQANLRNHSQSSEAVEYLKSRGVSGLIARDFGIGYAPDSWDYLKKALNRFSDKVLVDAGLLVSNDNGRTYDRFRNRIQFPIRDTRGRVIGFGGRILGEGNPKYLNSPETEVFHKNKELYGLFEARRTNQELNNVILVEGYMDVIALAQAGFTNVVATLGTATSERHFEKLFQRTKEVVCCFDGDKAGRSAAWKSLNSAFPSLTEGRILKFAFLPEEDDPDTFVRRDRKQFVRLIKTAVAAGDYFFNQISTGLDLASIDARARLAELAIPLLDKIPQGLYRTMMIERLGREAGVSISTIESRLGQDTPLDTAKLPSRATQSGLERKIAVLMVNHPELVRNIDHSRIQQVTSSVKGYSSIVDVLINYIGLENVVDTSTLLAGFIGNKYEQLLKDLVGKAPNLPPDLLLHELKDGVDRYMNRLERAGGREILEDLKENPTEENLARYLLAKKNQTLK
ncbi:MAG: DNA primase [Gammaproteobacteria bacterium]|nr:DNA primase [Gammaproteobacteria bacterium]